jgi:hypothetical protein
MPDLRIGDGDGLGCTDRGDDAPSAYDRQADHQRRSGLLPARVAGQRAPGCDVGPGRTFAAASHAAGVVDGKIALRSEIGQCHPGVGPHLVGDA